MKTLIILSAFIPFVLWFLAWRINGPASESSLLASHAMIAGAVFWFGWVTVTILFLTWRIW